MESTQPIPLTTGIGDTAHSSPPLRAVPRRVQELKEGPRKQLKVCTRRCPAPRWREQVISDLQDDESFNHHLAILKIICRIPEIQSHVPQLRLTSINAVARTYTVKYPPRDLIPFEKEARRMNLSYREIQEIKSQLFLSVKIMYNNGVRYKIHPESLYLYSTRSWDLRPLLFLGSVTNSDVLDIGQLDWKEQRDGVVAQIDRVFAPLEICICRGEAAELTKRFGAEIDLATSTIGRKNVVLDSVKADLTEAQAIMTEARQMMKDASTAIEGIDATIKAMYSTAVDSQCIWNRAHRRKENAEAKLKKRDAFNDRANALIQKYGTPGTCNEVGRKNITWHPRCRQDANVEMKNSNLIADDTKAADESIAQHGPAIAEANPTMKDTQLTTGGSIDQS
ncbi:hypothetical protein GGI35DRAFT_249942 [Trichoderma velutinum]